MLAKPISTDLHNVLQMDSSIYPLSYNGFFSDYPSLFHIMQLQQDYLSSNPGQCQKLCALFYNTRINHFVAKQFAEQISSKKEYINKLAIVGVLPKDRSLFRLLLLKENCNTLSIRFFHTVTEANRWLNE